MKKDNKVYVTGGDATVITKGITSPRDSSILRTSGEGLVPSPLIFKEDGIIKIGNVGDGLLVSIVHSKKIAFHGMRRLINSTGEALKGRRVTRGSSHGTIIQGDVFNSSANHSSKWIWQCPVIWDTVGSKIPEMLSVHATEKLILENERYKETWKDDIEKVNKAAGKGRNGVGGENAEPKPYTGHRIAKKFDDVVYLGTVKKYSAPYW
ncbi:hypothetical protein TrCOL_g11614, partial [Triparma columacea]